MSFKCSSEVRNVEALRFLLAQGQGKMFFFKKNKMKTQIFWVPFFSRVSFPGAGRRICRFRRFLRAACRLGVALLLDARTILRVTRVGLFLVLKVLDAARLSLRVLCMTCRIRWWQWVQPMLWGRGHCWWRARS